MKTEKGCFFVSVPSEGKDLGPLRKQAVVTTAGEQASHPDTPALNHDSAES